MKNRGLLQRMGVWIGTWLLMGCGGAPASVDALPFLTSEETGWGLIGTDGQVKVAPGRWKGEPSAVVNGRFALQDEQGFWQLYALEEPTKPVSNRRFARIGHFFEGVTLAQEFADSPILLIDRQGKVVRSLNHTRTEEVIMAHNFAEGRALCYTSNGKFGYLDTEGTMVIAPIYDQAYDFHEGMALTGQVNAQGEWAFQLIDTEGRICYEIMESMAVLDEQSSNGRLAYRHNRTRQCCYLDVKGGNDLFLPDSLCRAQRFEHRAAVVSSMHGTGLIDERGQLLIPPTYRKGFIAGENRVCLLDENGWQVKDFQGKHPTTIDDNAAEVVWESISCFYDSGLAIARKDSMYLWIDVNGQPIDRQTYRTIREDATALHRKPQCFYRQNKAGLATTESIATEVPKAIPTKTATAEGGKEVSFSTSKAAKESGMTTTDAKKKPTDSGIVLNGDEWRRISQQNPFYAEAQKVVSGKLEVKDAQHRRMILNYVEHLRTSYTTKDIDFLTQLFSDQALIIVGKVIRTAPQLTDGKYLPAHRVQYNVKSKQAYLDKLKVLFKQNKTIELKFSDFKIRRHPTKDGVYGVTLHQRYTSDLYADDGYLFLLWDFRDETAPLIHVRTWQPRWLDKHTELPNDEIFQIANFNLQ